MRSAERPAAVASVHSEGCLSQPESSAAEAPTGGPRPGAVSESTTLVLASASSACWLVTQTVSLVKADMQWPECCVISDRQVTSGATGSAAWRPRTRAPSGRRRSCCRPAASAAMQPTILRGRRRRSSPTVRRSARRARTRWRRGRRRSAVRKLQHNMCASRAPRPQPMPASRPSGPAGSRLQQLATSQLAEPQRAAACCRSCRCRRAMAAKAAPARRLGGSTPRRRSWPQSTATRQQGVLPRRRPVQQAVMPQQS